MPKNFADRLLDAIDEKQNPSCVGLDPVVSDIPSTLKKRLLDEYKGRMESGNKWKVLFEATGEAIFRFNQGIIDASSEIVPVFKPNMAFHQQYGPEGVHAFWRTVDYIRQKGALVIADVKLEDIGKTASFYARGFLGAVELIDGTMASSFNVDAVTLSPYIGSDSVGEFVKVCAEHGKGGFVLDKTSNPSSGELQDLKLDDRHGGRLLYEHTALLIEQWSAALKGERGYASLGAVVGANYPEQAVRCREIMPNAVILVPAYGAQGGTGKDTIPNFNEDGYGAIVNNSSMLIFAYKFEPYRSRFGEEKFAEAARESALAMREDVISAMRSSGKIPSKW